MDTKSPGHWRSSKLQIAMLSAGVGFLLIATFCTLAVVFYPYQHEYREGAPLVAVRSLLEHQNPYSFQVEPAHSYVYGILYPLLNYPISRLWGPTLVHARLMSWLYVATTVVLVFLAASRRGAGWGAAALAASLFPFTDSAKCIAQPVDLGILLCLATMLVPYWARFRPWSLLASVLLGIAAFFAKPYFVIGTAYTVAYLCLFRSKRAAFGYALVGLALGALSLYVAYRLMPTYLNDCVFAHFNQATNVPEHAVNQLKEYSARNRWLILAVLGLVSTALARTRWRRLRLDLLHPRQPLITGFDTNLLFELSAVIALLVFMYKMGRHTGGGGGTYLNHLLSPLLVLVVADKLDTIPRWIAVKYAAAGCLLVFLVQASRTEYAQVELLRQYRPQIAALEHALAAKQHVLNSPNTASMMVEQKKPVYDSGLSVDFANGDGKYSRCLLYGSAVADAQHAYRKELRTKVESRVFDAVLVTAYDQWKLPSSLAEHYVKKAVYPYPGLLGHFPVELWERR